MNMLEKYETFVKQQIAYHARSAQRVAESKPFQHKKHIEAIEMFQSMLDDFRRADEILEGAPPPSSPEIHSRPRQLRLALVPDDLDGLPEELIQELSIASSDKSEFTILTLLREAGGIMSLDQILVGLFKQTKEIHKRSAVTNRLYRMSQKGLVFSVPSKKGVYADREISEAELDAIMSDGF